MTEQHLGIVADHLETTERYNRAGLALGFEQYRRDTFREQCNSAWETAHRMLVAWKRCQTDSGHKWKVLLSVLNHLLPPCEMQALYNKLVAVNIKETGH